MHNLHLALLLLRTLCFADKDLVSHFYHLVCTILIEDYDIVYIGTVADVFVLFQRSTYETFLAVDVQFLVCLYYCGS